MKLRLLLCVLFLVSAPSVFAADLRGDTINLCSYQLKIDIRDFESHVLYGQAAIGIKAVQSNVNHIDLDLLRLTVDSVQVNGRIAHYAYNDSILHISFFTALNKNDSATIQVYYHGKPGVLPGDFGGFYWDERYAFNMGVSFISNPHNYGRVWYPCFDNFGVRSRYEFFITTRVTDKAFCNGLLLDVKTTDAAKVWHWKMEESMPSYLVSVAVADYATCKDTVQGINGTIPVEIAVAPEDSAILKKRFEHLHQAFHILEHYWGPYRWPRVGYCMVPFEDGAMEHATNIAFMQYYLTAYFRECETTMAHELSHHWFGNLVTCASAPEMWLNEGWATYSQSLFIEGLYGADSAQQYRKEAHLNEVQLAHVTDGGYLPVNGVPSSKTYGSTVYQKGGDVINTLRYYLGDSLFFSCVRGYLNQYAFKTAGTIQLRDYLSECSGKDMTGFFKDWIMAPGYPHFSISDKYVKHVKGKYEVYINIRQRLSHAPEVYNHVPVIISYFDRHLQRKDEMLYVSGEHTTYATELNFKPEFITLDFDQHLAQAVTSNWQILRDSGIYDFNDAQMGIQANAVKDSSFIWIAHNWLPADGRFSAAKNLHLDKMRYWTVDGVFNRGLKMTGIFGYSASAADPLDDNFIKHEDSLIMLYRPNQQTDWQPASSFYVDKGGSDSDMVGAVIVYRLKKGDYALAVYDANVPADTIKTNGCEPIHAMLNVLENFTATADKTTSLMLIGFSKNVFNQAVVYDAAGNKLASLGIGETENKLSVKLSNTPTESYVVTLRLKSGDFISKKVNNQ